MSNIRGKKMNGQTSKRSERRKKQTKVIKMKGFAKRTEPKINISHFQTLECVLNLTEQDVNNALKQQNIRMHGVLYDIPVTQLQGIIASKKFGPVKLTLTRSKSQELPVDPNLKTD
jgi:hypothetical protein